MKKRILYTMAFLLTGLGATAQIDRSKMPQSGPDPVIKMDKPYSFELKNGLQVLVVEDHKLPKISFRLNLDNPPIVEADKAGVQSLTSSMMGKGTTITPKDEFNEKKDFFGISLAVGPNGGSASGLSKYKADIFGLFAEAAFNPNFTQEELDLERSKLIEGLKSGENSAAEIAGRVRSALAYGKDHAAGEFATEETVNNVTLADVKAFYKEYFKPSRGYLLVSGDITKKEAKKMVKKHFKQWDKGTAKTPNLPAVVDVDQRQINLVDVPNAVQTELAVMFVSDLKMNDPDYHASLVMNYILGGGFGSYLNMNLREANGWTYGARTSMGTGRNYKSTFRATTKVRNEVTDSALVETFKEINRMRDTPVSEENLATAKAKYLGNFIMQSEDKTVVANRAVRIKTNDLPEDFYKNFIKNINAVTIEDVQRVAQKYLKPELARIVLVGKAKDILAPLEKLTIDGQPVPIKFYDKYANETERPSAIEIPEGFTAKTVLDNYIKAIGGEAAVKGVNDYTMFAAYSSPMGELIIDIKRMKGDNWTQALKMGGREMQKQVYSNGKGFAAAQGQRMDASGKMLEMMQSEAVFMPELYKQDMAKLEGAQRLEDKVVYVIDWGKGKKTFYDTTTGLMVGQESVVQGPQGEVTTMITFSDYKETSGIKFPMKLSQPMAGQTLVFDVKEIKVNTGLTQADFK